MHCRLPMLLVLLAGCHSDTAVLQPAAAVDARTPAPLRAQLFSRTTGFRHDSIDAAQRAIVGWADGRATITLTEDPATLIARLPETDAVMFLMTTGDVLDAEQERAFEAFIREGGGYLGVHSAADTEYDWPFYGELVGAYFADHPAVQSARMRVEAATHPAAIGLPSPWQHEDEWYNFRKNPRGAVDVVLTLDESSYSGGKMGGDHPIAWSHSVDKGRAFYTAIGHTQESWQDPLVVQHVTAALRWVARR